MNKKEPWVVGNYEIERFLGAGVYSRVYKARNRMSGNPAAVKIFHDLPNKDIKELIERETTNLSKLGGHKHIIGFLECSRPEDLDPYAVLKLKNGTLHKNPPFIVLELKKGNLRTTPSLDLPTILAVVKQIASALQYVHEHDIVHLDVKPENILWDFVGCKVFLSDFGISRTLDALTGNVEFNTTNGSDHHMAPECAMGNPCLASDQYSLAVTVYELLCKTKPFERNITGDMRVPSIREHRKNLPRNIDELQQQRIDKVLQKALQEKPKDRYESVEAFAKALEEAICNPLGVRHDSTRRHILAVAVLSVLTFISVAIAKAISWVNPAPRLSLGRNFPKTQNSHLDVSTPTIPTSGFGSLLIAPYQAKAEVTIAALSPDKQFVASGTISGNVDVWKVSDNSHAQFVHKQPKAIQDITWLDNRSIASTSDTHILAWDAFTEQVLPKWPLYHNEEGYDLNTRWSPEPQKKHVALYVGSKVIIFDNPLDSNSWTNRDKHSIEHTDTVSSVAWSPDGNLLASASYDTTVQAWNVETGQGILKYLGHQCPVVAVAWSPDGRYLASAGNDGVIHIYRALPNPSFVDGYYHSIHKEQSVSITALAWSLDSQFLASSGNDNRVRVWKLQTHQPLDYAGHKDAVNYISWLYHQQRQCIVSCSADKTIHIWRATQQL